MFQARSPGFAEKVRTRERPALTSPFVSDAEMSCLCPGATTAPRGAPHTQSKRLDVLDTSLSPHSQTTSPTGRSQNVVVTNCAEWSKV